MDYKNAIRCIQNKRYEEAANHMVKSILQDKIHQPSQRRREKVTIRIAKGIKARHLELKRRYGDTLKPIEIAENVYTEIIQELMPPEVVNHSNLSKQLEDDKEDT